MPRNPLHVTGNVDTSGVNPGDQATLRGITDIFDDAPVTGPLPRDPQPVDASVAAPIDTTATDQRKAGYSSSTDPATTTVAAVPGHFDTSASSTGSPVPATPVGEHQITPDPIADTLADDDTDDTDDTDADPAEVYRAMTVPKILAHAEANDHVFADDVSRKDDYIASLLDAGINPPD